MKIANERAATQFLSVRFITMLRCKKRQNSNMAESARNFYECKSVARGRVRTLSDDSLVILLVFRFFRVALVLPLLVDAMLGGVETLELIRAQAGRQRQTGEEMHQVNDLDADILDVDF